MTTSPFSLTSRDFDSIAQDFQDFLKTKYPDDWKNFYVSGISSLWARLVAGAFANASFAIDMQAINTYLSTATDREAVVNICRTLGYKLQPASAATVICTASIEVAQAEDVILSASLPSMQSDGGVTFRFLEDQTIPAGETEAEVTLAEGEQQIDTFAGTGTAFQKFALSRADAVLGSIEMTVDGAEWAEVNSLILAGETDKAFEVYYDADDYATITVGDGTTGMVVPADAVVQVAYRVGGGTRGNIALGQLSQTVTGTLKNLGTDVSVSIVNDVYVGAGGEERETTAHAKLWAPSWVASNGRAVTEQDFDALATAYISPSGSRVAFAKAMLHQEIPESNRVDLSIWARDGEGHITTDGMGGLIADLQAYFDNDGAGAVRLICLDTVVQPGEIVYVDIDAEVVTEQAFLASEVQSAAEAAVAALFTAETNTPGSTFRLSRLYDAIQSLPGVSHLLVGMVTASQKHESILDYGDGGTSYSGTLEVEPSLPIVPGTVTVEAGDVTGTDDGEGVIVGDGLNPAGTNTVDYDTGAVALTFDAAVTAGTEIGASYRAILSSSRSEQIATSEGVARFAGQLGYPPAIAWNDTYGMYGIVFAAGTQLISDTDGDGILYQDGDAVGTINYDTGVYDLTFKAAPVAGAGVWAAYTQRLQTPSEDIPITKLQLAVEGTTTLTVS